MSSLPLGFYKFTCVSNVTGCLAYNVGIKLSVIYYMYITKCIKIKLKINPRDKPEKIIIIHDIMHTIGAGGGAHKY